METRFIKKQMTAAYQYSYTRLALNYYTLYETLTEEPELPGMHRRPDRRTPG